MANVTLPGDAVECPTRSCISNVLFLVPFNLLIGDDTLWVAVANRTEDGFTIHLRSVWTGSRFEVMSYTASRSEVVLAKRAADISTTVDF